MMFKRQITTFAMVGLIIVGIIPGSLRSSVASVDSLGLVNPQNLVVGKSLEKMELYFKAIIDGKIIS